MDKQKVYKKFGERLQKMRKQQGLSQKVLAEQLGVDRGYISNLENGRRNPTLLTVAKISKALNIAPKSLLETIDT